MVDIFFRKGLVVSKPFSIFAVLNIKIVVVHSAGHRLIARHEHGLFFALTLRPSVARCAYIRNLVYPHSGRPSDQFIYPHGVDYLGVKQRVWRPFFFPTLLNIKIVSYENKNESNRACPARMGAPRESFPIPHCREDSFQLQCPPPVECDCPCHADARQLVLRQPLLHRPHGMVDL